MDSWRERIAMRLQLSLEHSVDRKLDSWRPLQQTSPLATHQGCTDDLTASWQKLSTITACSRGS
jgi:hypothetical protein